MLFPVVHTIGSTVYLIFFILFVCASQVPRVNPGIGWWALAILCALLSRTTYFVLYSPQDMAIALGVYSSINILEKLFLAIGIMHFIKKHTAINWLCIAAAAAELWLLCAYLLKSENWVYTLGLTIYNVAMLLTVGVLAFKHRKEVPYQLLLISALICFALVLHWIVTFIALRFFSDWEVIAFLIGTVLVLALYLSLISGILAQLYKRLIDAEANALDLAYQDSLTGLNNMRYVDALFDKALMLANRPHQLLAVIYIDLDNFKPINDTAGHHVGDKTLQTVARRLKENTRSTDICARVGGDEFVVVATQIENEEQVHSIARKLLAKLTEPVEIDSKSYSLGASIGISLYPLGGQSLQQLIENADTAMYDIKHHGKSGYRIFTPPTQKANTGPSH